MARTGRPPLPQAIKALVRQLAAAGHTYPEIIAALAARGQRAAKATISYIVAGRPESEQTLAPGERRLKTPQRCAEGHLIDVAPCRTCRLRRRSAARPANSLKAKAPNRARLAAVDPLALALPRAARARLIKIRGRKVRGGEQGARSEEQEA